MFNAMQTMLYRFPLLQRPLEVDSESGLIRNWSFPGRALAADSSNVHFSHSLETGYTVHPSRLTPLKIVLAISSTQARYESLLKYQT